MPGASDSGTLVPIFVHSFVHIDLPCFFVVCSRVDRLKDHPLTILQKETFKRTKIKLELVGATRPICQSLEHTRVQTLWPKKIIVGACEEVVEKDHNKRGLRVPSCW